MRLELSRRSDLAIKALHHLSSEDGTVSRVDIAVASGTSPDFAARVMAPLVKVGWVRSEPGRGGGYTLTTDLDRVSVLQVIRVVEGVPSSDACVLRGGPCDPDGRCEIHDAWSAARDALLRKLDTTPVGASGRQR